MLSLPAFGLVVNADLGADEHKAVLSFPELDHPVLAGVIELAAHSVIIENDERSADVIKLIKAEVALPGILVCVVNVSLGIVFIA